MVLEIAGALLGRDRGLFKKSPEDGQVDKYEGGKEVPTADNDTNTHVFAWKGIWSGATTYAVDDLVVNSIGAAYVCTAASTNNEPPNASYWDLLSSDTDTTYSGADFEVAGAITTHTGNAAAHHTATASGDIDHASIVNTHNLTTDVNHDTTANFDADKHRAWAASIAQNVHADNYTNTDVQTKVGIFLSGGITKLGNWRVHTLGDTFSQQFQFFIPHDFTSLTEAIIVIIPDTTETIQYDLAASVSAAGEDYNNDDRTVNDETLGVTINDLTELDVSGVLTSLSANDYVSLIFTSNTSSIRVVGFRWKYT